MYIFEYFVPNIGVAELFCCNDCYNYNNGSIYRDMSEEQLSVLSDSIVFRGMKTKEISGILDHTHFQVKTYDKGVVIAQAGHPCDLVRIILVGNVAGEMMDVSGKILKIEDLGPSKMIAPAFLYGKNRRYPVNVITSSRTITWQMHRADFSLLLQTDVKLLDNYLDAISSRAQFLSEKIRFLSFPSLRAKLAFLFLQQAGKDDAFTLTMTHQQLSELFGVARPSLTREIRIMNNAGLIRAEREYIQLIDRDALHALLKEN